MAEALKDVEAEVEEATRLADDLTDEFNDNRAKLQKAEDRLRELESRLTTEKNLRFELERVKTMVESPFQCY